jgi:DNA-binding GntR family transcriptional regulator
MDGKMSTASRQNETRQGQDAYDRLVLDIRAGRLKPGDRLVETDLAARLGISRTPVREAVRRLESDGLVVHQPRLGATVRKLDYLEITELYEMRGVLEGTAARLAARSASQIELEELEAINREMQASTDVRQLYEANRQFHGVLLSAARNRFLVKSVEAVQKTLLILGSSTLEEAQRAAQAIEEHDAILTALKNRDGDAAEASMRAHIEAAHKARLRQLRVDFAA